MNPSDPYQPKKQAPTEPHPQKVIGKLSLPATKFFNTHTFFFLPFLMMFFPEFLVRLEQFPMFHIVGRSNGAELTFQLHINV